MENETEAQKSENEQPVNPAVPEIHEQDEVTSEVVTIRGKVARVQANVVNIDGGQVRVLRCGDVSIDMKNGGIGAMFSGDADVEVANGGIGCVSGKVVTVKSPAVGFVSAWHANVEGEAKFIFDLRAGVAAGIVCGLVLAVSRLIFGKRAGQKCAYGKCSS